MSLIDNATPLLNHREWFRDGVNLLLYDARLAQFNCGAIRIHLIRTDTLQGQDALELAQHRQN